MELIISIISCVAAIGSLIVAIISLVKERKNTKEINILKKTYCGNSFVQEIETNSGINVGINGGIINEKK